MYIFASVTIFTVVTDFVLSEKTKDLIAADIETLSKDNIRQSEVSSPIPANFNPLLNSMWTYRPNSHPAMDAEDFIQSRVVIRPGSSVTRLAKTLAYGFNPYFEKAYFEPFEKRPKPVKLVAFNRYGRVQRDFINVVEPGQKPHVAELQSPFNEIGAFWSEEGNPQQ